MAADHQLQKSKQENTKIRRQPERTAPVSQGVTNQGEASTLQAAVENPDAASAATLQMLQRKYGNRAVSQMIQTKLTVGAAHDPYEQEADRVAGQVMRMSVPPAQPAPVQRTGEEDELQMKPLAAAITPLVQRQSPEEDELQTKPLIQRQSPEEDELQTKPDLQRAGGDGSFEAGADFEQQLDATRGGGAPLPDDTRQFMESRFGADFGGVRVHADSSAMQLNRDVQAQAFTHGQDIYFGAGKYNPSSGSGKQLLAHELTHVIQQTGGAPLQRQTEGSHTAGCACAACASLQTLGDNTVQRAISADAHAPGCGCSTCAAIQRMPAPASQPSAHMALDKAPVRQMALTPIPQIEHFSIRGQVQRHASWEHKMLGDVQPEDLAIMGAGRDIVAKEKERHFWQKKDDIKVKIKIGDQEKEVTKDDVLHVLEQEIERLRIFRDAPPQAASKEEEQRLSDLELERRKERAVLAATEEVEDEQGIAIRKKAKIAKARAIKSAVTEAEQAEEQSPRWQVRLVTIKHAYSSKQNVVTYGEMNTLGDFVGNPEQLHKMDPDNLHAIIQGIRQESLLKFLRLYDEIKGKSGAYKFLTQDKWGEGFEDAAGNTGRGDLTGELRLMMGGKTTVGGKEETGYSAGLGRNACHFAPFSWHAWANYHQKAEALARRSYQQKQIADAKEVQMGQEQDAQKKRVLKAEIEAARKEAATMRTDALIQNGFGDHFLQDSYAAGHLINKDEIMKWYVEWLDKKGTAVDYMRDATLQRMVRMVAQQGDIGSQTAGLYEKSQVGTMAPKDVQSVENSGLGYLQSFERLGLKLPGSLTPANNNLFKFAFAWQRLTLEDPDQWATLTPAKAKQLMQRANLIDANFGFPDMDVNQVRLYLQTMADEGVAERSKERKKLVISTGEFKFTLRKPYVPSNKANLFQTPINNIINPQGAGDAQQVQQAQESQESYKKGAASVTYKDYHQFMKSAVVQAATNILHDHFCANGLHVATKDGEEPFKIYGDNAMLQKESSRGLVHSSKTSNMSRDRIYSLADTDASPDSLDGIRNRFPDRVRLSEGQEPISLADWHNKGTLRALCEGEDKLFGGIFRKANASIKTFGGGIKGGDLAGVISKYERVHGGEAF